MVTVKLQETLLFDESVAVQVTVVVPNRNIDPDAGAHTVFTQFPVVVGAKLTAASPDPGASSPTL